MRYYELMCLLIEFSPQRPFCLQAPNEIPPEIQVGLSFILSEMLSDQQYLFQDSLTCFGISITVNTLVTVACILSYLLTIHSSPHATIDIFQSVKKNFDNPDVNRCLAIGNDDLTTSESNCIDDLTPQDILLSLPGINTNNFRAVMNSVTDLAQLSQMTVQQLTPLIGPINAKKLVSFFKQTL